MPPIVYLSKRTRAVMPIPILIDLSIISLLSFFVQPVIAARILHAACPSESIQAMAVRGEAILPCPRSQRLLRDVSYCHPPSYQEKGTVRLPTRS